MRDFAQDHSSLALNTATLGHNVEGAGFGWSPEQVIEACAERGFGAITFWRRELQAQQPHIIGERTRAAGLAISGLCRSPFLVGPLSLPERKTILDDFRQSIYEAYELGAPCLTICVGGVTPQHKGLESSLAQVAELISYVTDEAQAANVRLALEPLHPMYAGNRSCLVTTRDAVSLCGLINHPVMSVAIDVYHVWWDRTLAQCLAELGRERIAGFHLCDWLPDTTDMLLDRGMMGDGVADLKAIRQAVEATGYNGFCEVEIFSANNWWKRAPAEVLDICVERYRTIC